MEKKEKNEKKTPVKLPESKDIINYLQKDGYKIHEEALKSAEFSFRYLPQMIVKYEVDELARVVEQSEFSDKAVLVQDNEDRAAILLMADDKGRNVIDHVVMALEADFSDLEYLLTKVLAGHDEKGYVLTNE